MSATSTMSAVAELEANLQAMLSLKPPGVSGSKVTNITALCVANVQSESVLIQKIFTHFKKAPPTHKLGVLYIVDSVTRKWTDLAKSQGQAVNTSAQDGTYAAGVQRVTDLMPVLMNDIIQTAPADQKEKIKKLVDIWDKGMTFPSKMIEAFKKKLGAANESTTPPGSPPLAVVNDFAAKSTAPAAIFEALANIARQNATAAPSNASIAAQAPIPSGQNGTPGMPYNLSAAVPNQTSGKPPASQINFGQPVHAPHSSHAFPTQGVTYPYGAPAVTGLPNAISSAAPGAVPAPGSVQDPAMQQQVVLIKALIEQGIPVDKIPAIIQGLTTASGAAPPAQQPTPASSNASFPAGMQPWTGGGVSGVSGGSSSGPGTYDGQRESRDALRSPPNRYRGRSRSQSPPRQWDPRDAGRGRNDRNQLGHEFPGRGQEDQFRRGGPGQNYRQRSPHGRRDRSMSPHRDLTKPTQKWVQFDPSLPADHIRVLSRTLFVGGVTIPEHEVRNLFSQYGRVQTVIVNKEKRHAFVKMVTREEAVKTKQAMAEVEKDNPLRTRWGVGFGPRDNCDYATGISMVPISKLTEADRKWILSAENGGSGGQPIETGLVIEEPDIEIGAGVSSKAMSRRIQTDKGGNAGPRSSGGTGRAGDGGGGSGSGGGGARAGRNFDQTGDDHDQPRWRRGPPAGSGQYAAGRRDDDAPDYNRYREEQGISAGVHLPFGVQQMPMNPPGYPYS